MAAPGVLPLAAACTVPTLLGYWKSEYGVSYAYGTAMLATGSMVISSVPSASLARAHAMCVALYGLRLNLFLLYREIAIERFREFREKIEARAVERGSRIARTPFILSCAALYLGMAAPLVVTAQAASLGPAAPALLCLMYAGLVTAAVGDLWKTVNKAREGSDALVTSGPFHWLRHPNYSGEFVLWTANAAMALSAAVASGSVLASVGWLAGALVGAAGISFVLMQAATSLEAKQAEKHSGSPKYEEWLVRSWSGPTLPKKS